MPSPFLALVASLRWRRTSGRERTVVPRRLSSNIALERTADNAGSFGSLRVTASPSSRGSVQERCAIVNRFQRNWGALAMAERMAAPLADLLGWYSAFERGRILGEARLRIVEEPSLTPTGMMSLMQFVKMGEGKRELNAPSHALAKGPRANRVHKQE